MLTPDEIATDFAAAIAAVDASGPVAVNQRSKVPYQPGIGPFSESRALELIMKWLSSSNDRYRSYQLNVPYMKLPRQKCDVAIGVKPTWNWCIEVKLLRMLGDNGKNNDNMLMHILSPYEQHRSALTDCAKLLASGLSGHKAIAIYGFDDDAWPLEPAIQAFETLAASRHTIAPRAQAPFRDLMHPVHRSGAVFVWELLES